MITVKQLERLWSAQAYDRLFHELAQARIESSLRYTGRITAAAPAAAMTLIRLDELGQSHASLSIRLIRTLLATQDADGGWGDPAVTSLCLRALCCSSGGGEAVQRGLQYLANLQRADSLWPDAPLRRLPSDPAASAFILFQLGENAEFRAAVRFAEAQAWFVEAARATSRLAPNVSRAWEQAQFKCGLPTNLGRTPLLADRKPIALLK